MQVFLATIGFPVGPALKILKDSALKRMYSHLLFILTFASAFIPVSRYDPYASSYSSSYGAAGSSSSNYGSGAGGGGSSAIDRYYTYLNELSYGGSSSSNYGSNLGSSRLTSSNSYSSSSGSGSGASDLLSSRRSYRLVKYLTSGKKHFASR